MEIDLLIATYLLIYSIGKLQHKTLKDQGAAILFILDLKLKVLCYVYMETCIIYHLLFHSYSIEYNTKL